LCIHVRQKCCLTLRRLSSLLSASSNSRRWSKTFRDLTRCFHQVLIVKTVFPWFLRRVSVRFFCDSPVNEGVFQFIVITNTEYELYIFDVSAKVIQFTVITRHAVSLLLQLHSFSTNTLSNEKITMKNNNKF
jgi:hypothetical protein